MEDSFGGAAIALGIVQDALGDPVGLEPWGRILILAGGQRHGSGEAGAVESEGVGGEAEGGLRREVAVEES